MIDKSAFHKAMNSLIYTILRPISEKKQPTVLDHDAAAHLAKLVKLMNRVTSTNIDPTTVDWKETVSELSNALQQGGVCKDETIREQAVKELETVKTFFKQATAKSKATPAQNQPPKASL